VRTETSTQDHGVALGELPVNAVVCSPLGGEAVRGRLRARGYAITGGTRRIERVEVSLDQGENFLTAELLDGGDAGSWRLWEADLEVEPGPGELVVRAWDSAASTQPEDAAKIWNLKGYLNNAWHRVRFTAIQ
jgi:sulfite oxidase